MNSKSALMMLASATMSTFDQNDWDTYSGVESEIPLIGEVGEYVLVIDNDTLTVVDHRRTEWVFKLEELGSC